MRLQRLPFSISKSAWPIGKQPILRAILMVIRFLFADAHSALTYISAILQEIE